MTPHARDPRLRPFVNRALAGFIACLIATSIAARADERRYTAVVHVPLEMPLASRPRSDSYCFGERRRATPVPVPRALLLRYEARLRSIGRVTERSGIGSWLEGANPRDRILFENDDHVFVSAPLPVLERELPPLLHQMRVRLHQQEMLAELFATADGPGERRVRLEIVLPFDRANAASLQEIHRIFDDAGRSGASQFEDRLGVHVYSSVAPGALARIRAKLHSARFTFRSSPSNFITDVAPPCKL
jgi:hypothetical protein